MNNTFLRKKTLKSEDSLKILILGLVRPMSEGLSNIDNTRKKWKTDGHIDP